MWIDDQVLRRHLEAIALEVFVPKDSLVVLGSSNTAETEVNLDECTRLRIPVNRRYGGGGTVVLYPGCVVLTIGTWVKEIYHNDIYFRLINQSLIAALSQTWPNLAKLSQAGISDVVLDQRKVCGTSMFRSRNYLLYQASILVDLDLDLVSRCLAHPTKAPDYRKGRSHGEFLTSLSEISRGECTPENVTGALKENLLSCMKQVLGEHLIEPVLSQVKSLEDRLERANVL